MRNSQLNSEFGKLVCIMKNENVIVDKSKTFALRIIKLYKFLIDGYRFFPVADQVLKSGTSIGANVREAIRAQSKPDFYSKMNIALKESSETEYWLELLHESGYVTDEQFLSIYSDCKEITRILMAITKTQHNS